MAILIEGMEMPYNCWDCSLLNASSCPCKNYSSALEYTTNRHPDCPLVPVPPHGLIDRERILDSIRIELAQVNAVNDMEDYDSWMRVFDYVRKFPTVIPASEEGET